MDHATVVLVFDLPARPAVKCFSGMCNTSGETLFLSEKTETGVAVFIGYSDLHAGSPGVFGPGPADLSQVGSARLEPRRVMVVAALAHAVHRACGQSTW
eukprot:COSAG03_NODE_1025_length_4996_cov_2.971615_5_plen_98_part_01